MTGGSINLTADGLVAGAFPTRVYSIVVKSTGTAAVVKVLNGTGGTEYDQIDGTISKAITRDYGQAGAYFPSGCYIDLDGNTTYVTVNYEKVSN